MSEWFLIFWTPAETQAIRYWGS